MSIEQCKLNSTSQFELNNSFQARAKQKDFIMLLTAEYPMLANESDEAKKTSQSQKIILSFSTNQKFKYCANKADPHEDEVKKLNQ